MSAAIVMPEIGLALTPISPVMRDDTTTKKNPNTTMSSAPRRLTDNCGSTVSSSASAAAPDQRYPDRQIDIGPDARGSVADASAQILKAGPERRDDRRERADQRDDARTGHGAGADVEDEVRSNLGRAHIDDELRLGEDRLGKSAAEELDRRNEDQIGDAATGEQIAGDAGTDDVSHAEQLG